MTARIKVQRMTPQATQEIGCKKLNIQYGFHPTPFGDCLLAVSGKAICGLYFNASHGQSEALKWLKKHWGQPTLIHHPQATEALISAIFSADSKHPLFLLLKGTPFQQAVWEALLRIPSGSLVSYEQVAQWIQKPAATRAVANAIAQNPVSYLVPCHRVIRKNGTLGGYAWGLTLKKALIDHENRISSTYVNM